MAITVVGSVAFDTIETPSGRRERCLGGAATHFSLAASFFTDVRVIAVVGEDFGPEQEAVFKTRGINTVGIERASGKSFFWEGSYLENLNEAKTHNTELNVFGSFEPKIPDSYRDSEYLFLANIDPVLQKRVREAMPDVKLVAGDTMNYWIKDHKPALLEVLEGLDILVINDTETRMLAGMSSLVKAAQEVMSYGPRMLVVKHGEYGATLFHKSSPKGESAERTFRAPALPLEEVVDPTGAGDSFAGGFFGYLASQPHLTPGVLRRAIFYGSVMGSFAVEKFGTERIANLTREEIDERFEMFRVLTHLD
ncbi:PfkB family carbohydrate kinase [Terracidiphilus gabretensis]|uniref:PfkB family carbohydrate kinase n=1 Tax=Terracidiphilus gabretensis TaxID=1577687 RepID=UPI00071C1CD0|nr:PfkB family carbohydrate kinase [Terracidiphilus gabretensis]